MIKINALNLVIQKGIVTRMIQKNMKMTLVVMIVMRILTMLNQKLKQKRFRAVKIQRNKLRRHQSNMISKTIREHKNIKILRINLSMMKIQMIYYNNNENEN